ncbi:ABC transporter permease [Leifsonia sp. NPDC058230]|uniref:ABC transporter permease n=1 Tax=Leifsonia sp. NPDC058230 TaxID=3346391 RepID=UPI0036DB5AA1
MTVAAEKTTGAPEETAPQVLRPTPPRAGRRPGSVRVRLFGRSLTLWWMALPALAVIFVFQYIPMAGLLIAFQNYKASTGLFGSQWVGFSNFEYLFATNDALRITVNTVFMNSLFILANLVVALLIAILLNEVRDRWAWLGKFYQSVLFLPHFFSWVVVSYFALAFLDPANGLINHLLEFVGLPKVNWYGEPGFWPAILTIVSVWKNVGFWVIVYTAGILAISPELYEAARIDRASKWQQIRHITIPSLMPLIIINFLLSVGGIFRADFGLFYMVTNNSTLLYPTTDVIDTYVYRSLTSLGDVGMASAAGFYQAIVGFALVIIANWLVRRNDPDRALF